jgi:small-conductance mechanosensitive channel
MVNNSAPVGGAHEFDSDVLEQWVTETANQKGVSKQKLLDEILSSYWVLEELSGVITNSNVTSESRQSDGQPLDDSTNKATADERSTTEDSQSGRSSTTEFSELKSELQGLQTAIEALSDKQQNEADETHSKLSTESGVVDLEHQLRDLSSAVIDRQGETNETVTQLSDRLDKIEDRLDEIESELDGHSLSELESTTQQTRTAQHDLETRLESEFDSIEQVLQHLLDTTDNIEYRLGAVSDSRQEALKPIRERNDIQQELAELKQEALRHEVKTCVCDHCDQQIDLGLLEVPFCPSCERQFTGIAKGGWLPFSKSKIKTTDQTQESDNSEIQESIDRQQSSNRNSTTAGSQPSSGRDGYQTNW